MKKTYNKAEWNRAKKGNSFKIIPISQLPDDCPVLVVQAMPSKSLAEFHLAEVVLVPKTFKNE